MTFTPGSGAACAERALARMLALLLPLATLALAGCAVPDAEGPAGDAATTTGQTAAPGAGTSGAAAGGTTAPATTPARTCKGTHAHATFAVFTQQEGGPRRVDYAAPRAATGEAWYDLGVSPTMTVAVHLHQHGAEQGNDTLGPAQFHYESPGRCATVAQSLAAVETRVESGGITLHGGHARAQQDGAWPGPVRAWLQSEQADSGGCAWAWREAGTLADWLGHIPQDGEALLAAAGTFTADEVAAMQRQVPAPMTRAPADCA